MTQLGNNYPNPLDNFRTYSYHFIMTAASTTEAFGKMIGNDNGSSPLLAAINDVGLGGKINLGPTTEAFLILDTRRFAQYTITDIEMQHIYGTGKVNNPTVPAGTMKIKMLDTTGLTFFNFMMDLMRNKLQTSRASAFFLLAIVFVGHKDDGTTETISTCYIPLTLLLMSFEFTSSGSTYDMEFMELEGAPQMGSSMKQIANLGNVSSATTSKRAKTVGGLMDSLEDQLNTKSLEHFAKYHNAATAKAGNSLVPGKLVQYMITVPEAWQQMDANLAASDGYSEIKFASAGKTARSQSSPSGKDRQVSFSPTSSITDAIKSILESSKAFMDLASVEKRKKGEAVAFKTVTNITSDNSTYVIHFDIYPYRMPKMDDAKDKAVAAGAPSKVMGDSNIVKNLITYDYIFTGKNSHIKDLKVEFSPESVVALDTNLQLGKQRFAEVASKGNTPKAVESASKGAKKTEDFVPSVRPGDPVFLPMVSKEQRNNNSSQHVEEQTPQQAADSLKSKQEYNQTFAFLHFLSSINLDLVVRGNPNIIKKYADRNVRGGMAPHGQIITANDLKSKLSENTRTNLIDAVSKGVASSKQQYIKEYVNPRIVAGEKANSSKDSLLNGVDISTLPVFVKLNILAPNVDFTGEYKPGEPMFTDKFFFDGVYQVLIVTTSFSGGDFQHSMSLIPYDTSGSYEQSGDSKK